MLEPLLIDQRNLAFLGAGQFLWAQYGPPKFFQIFLIFFKCSPSPIDVVNKQNYENMSLKWSILILEKAIFIQIYTKFRGAPGGPLKILKFGISDIVS